MFALVVLSDISRGHESRRTMTRVLVVDDDLSGAMIVSSVMASEGYTVDVAHDGESALRLLEKCRYDLGIFDFEMPGMNGVELFREARQQQPELVGIFVTAHTDISTVFPAIEAGIERVFAKPINSRELIRVAGELVAG
jgi:CheY-like chemotaxis protein